MHGLISLKVSWSAPSFFIPSGLKLLITISDTFTSHYTVAISREARDVGWFLDHHAEILPQLPLHSATHPPGSVLYYRGVLGLCESWEWMTGRLVDMAARLGVELGAFELPRQRHLLAAALLAPLIIMFGAAATCVPIALSASRIGLSPMGAVRVGIIWVCVPGPLLMVPELDQLLALPIALFAALLLIAVSRERRSRTRYCFVLAAGVLAVLAMGLSYGAAVFLAVASVFVASAATNADRRRDAFPA